MDRSRVVDNAKFLTIFLVVLGHAIEPIISDSPVVKTLYMCIYSFHMPVFIILSGMLTKLDYTKERADKNISSILIPFLAFTVLYEGTHILVVGKVSDFTLNLEPYWLLWYLLSLFVWRLMLPVVLTFRLPLATSVVVSLVVGYVDSVGYFFDIARTIYFFPFFLLGYKLKASLFTNVRLTRVPKVFYLAVIALNVALFWFLSDQPEQWLYGSESYDDLGVQGWQAASMRLGLYAVSLVTALSVLMLMPRGETKFSKFGPNSLYIYLWHGFLIEILIQTGATESLGAALPVYVVLGILFIGAGSLSWVLAAPAIAEKTKQYIFDPTKMLLLSRK